MRGWLQLSIVASHVYGSLAGAVLIHGAWGFSDSSEQFVSSLLPSAALWLGVQAGLPAPDLSGSPPAFNPLAWQVLFLLGAFLGRQPRDGGGAAAFTA